MTKVLRISMIMLLITLLGACGTRNNDHPTTTNNATETNTTTTKTPTNETTTHETTTVTPTNETTTNNATGTMNHKLELADDVADKITKMKDVKAANVIVTDQNAYVAVELKQGVNASKELENKIADEARATNANFKNVYVSTNPDLAKQFTEYGKKIRANEPVEGFFQEFSDTVKRVFPTAH